MGLLVLFLCLLQFSISVDKLLIITSVFIIYCFVLEMMIMILIVVKIYSRITLPTPAILSELSAQRVRLEILFSRHTKCFSHRDFSENIYRFSMYNYSRTIYDIL